MRLYISFFLFFFSLQILTAQVFTGSEAYTLVQGSEIVRISESSDIPSYIKFRTGNEIDYADLEIWLNKSFTIRKGVGYQLINQHTDKFGDVHDRYQQYFNGVAVHHAQFVVHTRLNKIYSINGIILKDPLISTNPGLSEKQALGKALDDIGADIYKWELPDEEQHLKEELDDPSATYFPEGTLSIVPFNGDIFGDDLRLAYKFDIYAHKPVSRKVIFVDAQSGEIVYDFHKIHHADSVGSAITKYSDTVKITSDYTGSTYRLRESGRGNGIETYDMNQGTSYSAAVDFTDSDNVWNNFNAQKDEIATDAHWGAEMTYDYYYFRYNRNSIDGNGFKLRSYVHYDVNYANAFWDGYRMTYGDGSGSINPLVAMDIVAHEITHGLTSYTANLDYSYESGAINEAFSDIFGTSVEFYAKPNDANWLIGEDIGSAFRSMSNPNFYSAPDTYLGNYWYTGSGDYGGVHTNNSVLNYWFYLLSEGGSGTNDINNSYSVNGVGIDTAATIAYRMLTVYLTNTSQYSDARFYGIISATDLYGACSTPVESATDAFYAIGVGNAYVQGVNADFTSDFTAFCQAPATVSFSNMSNNGSTYYWDFGDGSTSTSLDPTHTYQSNGNYSVKLISNGGSCGIDSIIKTAYISIDPGNPCIALIPASGTSTQTSCFGTLYDDGGVSNYSNNTNSTVIISPTGASNVVLNFTSFNFESGYDYLHIYDGPNTSSNLIGSYDGNSLPNGGTIVSTGSSITLRQETDVYVAESGFELSWSCNFANTAPAANFTIIDSNSCTGEVIFVDQSTNGPTSWYWDFGDGDTSSTQNPSHTYNTNGYFSVRLISTNAYGTDTVVKTNIIYIDKPAGPTVTPAAACDSSSLSFYASGTGTLYWYDSQNAVNYLDTGNVFTTPMLSSTTTYFVEDNQIPAPINGAKTDNSGGGAYFTANAEHALYFNVSAEIILKSVKVYSGSSGNRTIKLLDVAGNTLNSKTINIPSGTQWITLDFVIPPGSDYRLAGSASPDLYRNNAGLNYPYTVGNVVNITKSTASSDPTGYYYYFYNWEVQETGCTSIRIPATAFIHSNAPTADYSYSNNSTSFTFTDNSINGVYYNWDFDDGNTSNLQNPTHVFLSTGNFNVKQVVSNGCGADSLTKTILVDPSGISEKDESGLSIYPNPSNGIIYLNFDEMQMDIFDIEVLDVLGKRIYFQQNVSGAGLLSIDLSAYGKGLYNLRIIRNKQQSQHKIILQ